MYRLDKARHEGNKMADTASKNRLVGGLGLYRDNRDFWLSSPLVRFELQRTEVYLKRKPFIRVCGYKNFFHICTLYQRSKYNSLFLLCPSKSLA